MSVDSKSCLFSVPIIYTLTIAQKIIHFRSEMSMPSLNNDHFTVVPVMKFWTTGAKVISVGQKFLETKSKHCTQFANKES